MGTNYYVRVPECDKACEHCGRADEIHLGKSSGGWRFLHRAYREFSRPVAVTWDVVDRESWSKLLDLGPIFDENAQEQSKEELLDLIESKQPGTSRHSQRGRDIGGYAGEHYFQADGYDFCDSEFS